VWGTRPRSAASAEGSASAGCADLCWLPRPAAPAPRTPPVDKDHNHLPAGILLPAESMRPAWLRARRALLRVADGIHPCPVLWP